MTTDPTARVDADAEQRTMFGLAPSAGWLALAQIAGQGMAAVTSVLLARRLGVAGFGVYAVAIAVFALANIVTTFGTDMVLIRESASGLPVDRTAAALVLQLTLSAIAIVVIAAVSMVVAGRVESSLQSVIITSVALLPSSVTSVGTAVLRGVGETTAYAILVAAAAAVPLSIVVVFVQRGDSPARAAAAVLAGHVVLAVFAGAICARAARCRTSAEPIAWPRWTAVAAMARSSATIGRLGVLGMVYQRLAMLSVAILVGPVAAGWYAGAARVSDASKIGHGALASATYPLMARVAIGDADPGLPRTIRRSRWAVIALGVAVSLIVGLAGPSVVSWLYGPVFRPAGAAVRILALGITPSTIAVFQILALFAARLERDVLRCESVSLAVLAFGLATLVGPFGWLGACWAMVAADAVLAVSLTLRARSVERDAKRSSRRLVDSSRATPSFSRGGRW